MKNTTKISVVMFCALLGCADIEQVEPPLSLPAGEEASNEKYAPSNARTATLSLQVVSTSTLQRGTIANLSPVQTNPTSYLHTENGITYALIQNITGLQAFSYLGDVRIHANPTVLTSAFPYDAVRTGISRSLNQLPLGASFKNILLADFDYVRNIDNKSFSNFETYIENRLSLINIQRPGSPPQYTELEKFALTQAYYNLLNVTRWIHENPPTALGSCLPQTTEAWKSVARAAIISGLAAGGTWAYKGFVAGALASGPNAPAGAVIGALGGFVAGFIGGAIAGGGLYMIAECAVNKLFSPLISFTCSGHTYFAATASPPYGCTEGGAFQLTSLANIPVVPNKGKSALHPTVVSDFNYLFGLL